MNAWTWGLAVIAMAVALVAGVILLHKSDTQTIMAVIGFANGIVTGTFGLMVAGRRRRPPGQHHDAP